MNASLWSIWNTTAQPALAGLKAGEWALLLVLGASLLVLSALRERYLLVWTAGWALLVTSRLAGVHGAAMRIPAALCSGGGAGGVRGGDGTVCGRGAFYTSESGICWRRWLRSR